MDKATEIITQCTGWCLPLYLQLAILAFEIIFIYFFFPEHTPGGKNRIVLQILLVGLLFSIIIYYLCQGCHNWTAWIVFFIPIIFGIVTLTSLIITIKNINNVLAHLKMNPID